MTVAFRIAVSFSAASNDHQVRYFLDGQDLIAGLWGEMLGMDPDDVLSEPCPLSPGVSDGPVTVARCGCGEAGCSSEEVRIQSASGTVRWLSRGDTAILTVGAEAYEREVVRALTDFTWETPDRTAARLFSRQLDARPLQERGLRLEWVSGRVRTDRFSASLSLRQGGHYQVLVHVPWRRVGPLEQSDTPDAIAGALLAEINNPPEEWADVEWSPMNQGLGAPKCAGRGWRPLGTP